MKTKKPTPTRTHRILLRGNLSAMAVAALLIGGTSIASAADANPPARMSFQSFVVDANGVPLGNANVANFDVVFRIYNNAQGGQPIWAELQTVTVDKGNFSVVLGEGAASGNEPHVNLDEVFAGTDASDRYIGITVKGLPGAETEVAPRMRLLPAPYSFLAKNALTLTAAGGAPLYNFVGGAIQSVGGALRGNAAVDLQTTRAEATQVAAGNYSVVAGGQNNRAGGLQSSVVGGNKNVASGDNSFIGGGLENLASGITASIVGGFQNKSTNTDSFIGGGGANIAGGYRSVIGGGGSNRTALDHSAVLGGFKNTANGINASVGGGAENNANGTTASIGGGFRNHSTGLESFIGGGTINTNTAQRTVIGGGLLNRISGEYGVIAGGLNNLSEGGASAIGGGDANKVTANHATVSGGILNTADHEAATVGGGTRNKAAHDNSTVAGGIDNSATGISSFVGGGNINVASGTLSTVAGGLDNQSTGVQAVIAGGHLNRAAGLNSAVLGGYNNSAAAAHTTALGRRAKANHAGSLVWADDEDLDFASTGNRQYLIRAGGGVGINTASPSGAALHVASRPGNPFVLNNLILLNLEAKNVATWSFGIDNQVNDPDLVFLKNGVEVGWIEPDGSGFRSPSDRRLKKDVEPLEPGALERVTNLPVVKFHMLQDAPDARKQIGVIAQDLQTAFPELVDNHSGKLGVSYERLGVVAVAAIQELKSQKDAEIQDLKRQVLEMKAVLDEVRKAIPAQAVPVQ